MGKEEERLRDRGSREGQLMSASPGHGDVSMVQGSSGSSWHKVSLWIVLLLGSTPAGRFQDIRVLILHYIVQVRKAICYSGETAGSDLGR